jgi:hypothetical protein
MKTLKLLLQALLEWVILIAVILIVSWVIIQILLSTLRILPLNGLYFPP